MRQPFKYSILQEEYESGDDTGLEPKEREEAEKRMRQMEAERRKKEEKRAAFLLVCYINYNYCMH